MTRRGYVAAALAVLTLLVLMWLWTPPIDGCIDDGACAELTGP